MSRPIRGSSDLKQEALIAWLSLYIAVGTMALICAVIAMIATFDEYRAQRWRPAGKTALDKALLLPKICLRWQINYLKGAPVIIAISLYYASSIGFSVFWNV